MRGLAALVLLTTALMAGLVQSASAQRSTTDMNRPMMRDTTLRHPRDLAEVCNVLVFRKYGAPGPRWAGTALEMDPDTHVREQNRCILTKGEGYGNPNDTRGLQRFALRTETPIQAPEVKPIPEVKPVRNANVEPARNTNRADPAPAPVQESKPQRSRQAGAVPSDPTTLAAYCNAVVFRKYGKSGPRWGAKFIEMDQELHAQMQNSCIMSKGRNY